MSDRHPRMKKNEHFSPILYRSLFYSLKWNWRENKVCLSNKIIWFEWISFVVGTSLTESYL
jgi:hypothetical protein